MLRRGRLDLAAASRFRDHVLGELTKAGIDPTQMSPRCSAAGTRRSIPGRSS